MPLVLLGLLAAVLIGRLFYLQFVLHDKYTEMAQKARTVSFPVEARRGTIYDRNGVILATDIDATTIYANPSEVTDPKAEAEKLAEVLEGTASEYLKCLVADETSYSIIERKADVDVAKQVKDLGLDGIYFVGETKRIYPNGQVAGQVVGACSEQLDEETGAEFYQGASGLEYYYDDLLSGEMGFYEAEKGMDGTPIPGGLHESIPAVDGSDIVVSIDVEMQYRLEQYLAYGVEKIGGNGGSAVLMDGETGEIYAAASLPLFNPADRSTVEEGATQLKAVTDLFEPGSIFKSVSACAILETQTMKPDTKIFCPAYIEVDGFTISDAHDRIDATFTLEQIMDQSSNIGILLSAEKMGFDKLYDYILRYNLHSKTNVDYPGEGEWGYDELGYLPGFDKWSKAVAYNISFGQGISVTPLQMVRFYGALVNNGLECTPHFLLEVPQGEGEVSYDTVDVIENKEAIGDLTSMLCTVVSDGTGKSADIDGYTVAGKTSTAEIYDEENGGYREGVFNLAFTGFLPGSNSKLVCFVGANEVKGDGVVTPIFRDIMTSAIERYRITEE